MRQSSFLSRIELFRRIKITLVFFNVTTLKNTQHFLGYRCMSSLPDWLCLLDAACLNIERQNKKVKLISEELYLICSSIKFSLTVSTVSLQVPGAQDLVDFSPVYRCLHIYTVLVSPSLSRFLSLSPSQEGKTVKPRFTSSCQKPLLILACLLQYCMSVLRFVFSRGLLVYEVTISSKYK